MVMTPETLAALDASIAKWDRIAESGDDSALIGWRHCPLCSLFIRSDCAGCPVFGATGEPYCGDTPFSDVDFQLGLLIEDHPAASFEDFRAAAREEALFLRAIRPIGEEARHER